MTKRGFDSDDLRGHISKLKHQQRFLRTVAGLAAGLALCGLVAFASNSPGSVRAQRIELVDSTGRVHAALTADTSGAVLTLLDKRGRMAATLQLNDEPRLSLRDAAGREVAGLGAPRVQHLAE